MSGTDAAPQRYGAIIVVGGGCYGGYYVRQLHRAALAGAIVAREIVVVDRDGECPVARELRAVSSHPIATRVVIAEWREFFDEYMSRAASNPAATEGDAIVPSPLMPHLMGEWIVSRARARWPGRRVDVASFDRVPAVPWERAGTDGSHYVSFATWMCPINCIEPRTCPHTRGARTWSMPEMLGRHASGQPADGPPILVAALHCRHRTYGVGMFDTAEVLDADRRVARTGEAGPLEVVVGTVSHCHGALTRLVIGAPAAGIDSHVG